MKASAIKLDPKTATIESVREKAIETIGRMEDGSIHFAMAKEISNAVGKAISSVKVQLEYAALRKERPDIPFLNVQASGK